MSTNINPDSGIRYGIISANALDPEVINDIQSKGRDVYYEEFKEELRADIKKSCGDLMSDVDSDDVADMACERMSDHYEQSEPVHEFEIDGVKGRTTWLGGALMVWVFDSPYTDNFNLCSPCVPGACDLDSPEGEGYLGYDVPADWRNNHD